MNNMGHMINQADWTLNTDWYIGSLHMNTPTALVWKKTRALTDIHMQDILPLIQGNEIITSSDKANHIAEYFQSISN